MSLPDAALAQYFDGQRPVGHAVTIALAPDRMALEISGDVLGAEGLRWSLTDLRATDDHADPGQLVLTRFLETEDESPRDLARLVIGDAGSIAWLNKTRPNLFRKDLRAGTGRRIALTASSALVAVVLLLFVILPALANTLARFIPLEREIAFGKSVTAQMERVLGGRETGALHCKDPNGQAALDAMTARLTAGMDIDYDLDVRVFDHKMVNAFAAPGGQVVLLRGLIDRAAKFEDGSDAVAGVLAHEIAHVVSRDPTRAALRTVGSAGLLSLVLGDVTGGTLLVFVGDHMLNSSYTREAERAADLLALEMLENAGISSEGMSRFFDVLLELQGELSLPEILSTHPDTAGRAALARERATTQGRTTPALAEADWAALQDICD